MRINVKQRTAVVISAALALTGALALAGAPAGAQSTADTGSGGSVQSTSDPVPAQYIVTLRTPAPAAPAAASALTARNGGAVIATYSHALSGYSARMTDAQARRLSQDPAVASVEQDGYVHATATETPTPSWGLDRIDQHDLPLDNSYTPTGNGAGVTAYIIDTGIRTTVTDFGGRASVGYDAVGDGQNGNDCNGHGTHVAGTVGGTTYGVAKSVSLVAVRVLDCTGSGTFSQVIAGVDWVTAHHAPAAVANMSLGGGAYSPLDTAIANSVGAGVTYAIAAGNSGADACNYSPARAPSAITVGATDTTDARASYSNYGTCVDLFAPGSGITSDWNTSDTATNTISGTSMATPHVTGSAALYLADHPGSTPATVTAGLLAAATTSHVTAAGVGSPNLLDFVGTGVAPPPPPPTTVPAAPVLSGTAAKRSVRVTWTVPANGGSAITGYKVYRKTATTVFVLRTTLSSTTTTFNDTGLSGATQYSYSVTAVNVNGESVASNTVTVTPRR